LNTHFESVDLTKVLEIIVAFNNERDFFKLLDTILSKMRDIANCEAGSLYVVQDEKLHFTIVHNEKLGVFLSGEEITLPPVSLDQTNIENVSAFSAINNSVVIIDDVYDNTEFNFQGPKNYDAITGFKTQSMMVFPLLDLHENVIGVIQLINSRGAGNEIIPFDKNLEFAFRSISNIAASALANMQNIEEISGLFYSFVRVMSQAIDERTPYNVHHAKQTAEYAKGFILYLRGRFPEGDPFHIDKKREEQLILALLLHDIGKVVTPLDIISKETRLGNRHSVLRQRFVIKKLQIQVEHLSGRMSGEEYQSVSQDFDEKVEFVERINIAPFLDDEHIQRAQGLSQMAYIDENGQESPIFEPYDMECLSIRKGTLTTAERDVMQEHVAVTGRLIDNIKFNKQYENVPDWVKKHHEFLDGTGYPEHITQDNIPMEARIITMLDIFDALTANDRPYRKATSYEGSINILRAMAEEGKLDAQLVSFFADSGVGDQG